MTRMRTFTAFSFALALGAIGLSGEAHSADPVLRFAVITSGGQSEEIIDFAAPGQQYTMIRSDAADIAGGNFIDLMRQRKAGVGIQAVHGFMGYNNLFVTKADSSIKTFEDLKGKKVGNFGTTFLDWLIVRVAGKKGYNIDLEKDATLVQGAPPLLGQFLTKGEVDAIFQFSTLTLAPVSRNEQRVVSYLPDLMKKAGLGADPFYLTWMLSEKWSKANPEAVGRLSAMLNEAYQLLKTDDSLWPTLAERIRITDPALIVAYREHARKYSNPAYRADLLKPTQDLVTDLVSIAGEQAVGITGIDPAAFLFPTPTPAK